MKMSNDSTGAGQELDAVQRDCQHDMGIQTWRFLDGTAAGMWSCTQCSRKFVPLDLAMEKDAERYRGLIKTLEKINEWCCYASEEDTSARLMALQQIGVLARDAIASAA